MPGSHPITTLPLSDWHEPFDAGNSWQRELEEGRVLYCPDLSFRLEGTEERFFAAQWSDPKRKSIYIRHGNPELLGSTATGDDRDHLYAMLARFEQHSTALIERLCPSYQGKMRPAGTSFRPRAIGSDTRALSWRKDDRRLHVDAFPSNPTLGMRILRVFANVGDVARSWRVGEPFEDMARHFMSQIPKPSPIMAQLQFRLGITKRVRSDYDHFMLHLHDLAKADMQYQRDCQQIAFDFPPGCVWICFSDQVMHAAMAGQYMLEQTIHVPPQALAYPNETPLAILERLTARPLVEHAAG
jgi:hypothetical protein